MYQFVGKTAPFLILACLALGDGCQYIYFFTTIIVSDRFSNCCMLSLLFFHYRNVFSTAIARSPTGDCPTRGRTAFSQGTVDGPVHHRRCRLVISDAN